jgi:hypothetical protein
MPAAAAAINLLLLLMMMMMIMMMLLLLCILHQCFALTNSLRSDGGFRYATTSLPANNRVPYSTVTLITSGSELRRWHGYGYTAGQ